MKRRDTRPGKILQVPFAKISVEDRARDSPWQVLCRSCCARSVCKAICTRCLKEISTKDLCKGSQRVRSLFKLSTNDLHARPLWSFMSVQTLHTHLLRNILSNYWCGMHRTCKNTSVKPDRNGLMIGSEKLCEEIFLSPCWRIYLFWCSSVRLRKPYSSLKTVGKTTCRFLA